MEVGVSTDLDPEAERSIIGGYVKCLPTSPIGKLGQLDWNELADRFDPVVTDPEWGDNTMHKGNLDGVSVRCGGLVVSMSSLLSQEAIRTSLADPLVALIQSAG